jgi:type I restriction enzyme S subunit
MSSNEWKEVSLEDIIDILGDGLHGTPKYDQNGEYYFINGNNLNGSIVIDDKTKKVGYEEYIRYKKDLNDRTILISINGTLGKVAVYNGENVVLGKSACYLNIKQNSNKEFIKYVLNSDKFKHYLNTYSTGTTIKNMGLKHMRAFKFYIPLINEQKAIADTLSCLDEKIELNNCINNKLQEMAQEIFKNWLIDFEPFQDGEFIDSELGKIPLGWKVDSLVNIADFLNGLAMQKYRPKTDDFLPVIKIKELNQGFTDASSDKASVDIPAIYSVSSGDILFSWSGTLMVKIWTGGKGGLNQHLFKVTSKLYDKWFYYLWTLRHIEKFQAIAKDRATTMGHIKRGHLAESKVIIPSDIHMKALSNVLNPIIEKVIVLSTQTQILKEMRDLILPKLVNGEIKVPTGVEND